MTKIVFAIVLGGILGVFDGLSSWVSEPEVRPMILTIVVGSTFKGVVTGLAVALFERKVKSLALGVLFGLAVGLGLAYLVTLGNPPSYFWKIMLPGGLVGLLVGYGTVPAQGSHDTARALTQPNDGEHDINPKRALTMMKPDWRQIELENRSLSVRSASFLGEGWGSYAYLVNDELVFRFPKRQGWDELDREIKFLAFAAAHLPLAVAR